MRDLEFRAYNKKDKMMQYVAIIEWLQGGLKVYDAGVYIANGWVTVNKECPGQKDVEPEVVLMQYTGVKDSRGTKIYEGDLVCYFGKWDENGKVLELDFELYEVCWVMGGFWAIPLSSRFDSSGKIWRGVGHTTCEVAGNVWENPELVGDRNVRIV